MREKDTQAEQLKQIIRRHYRIAVEQRGGIIVTNLLASSAYRELDPDDLAPLMVRYAAVLQLRQFSRAICRGEAEQAQRESEALIAIASEEEWAGHLQERYPAKRIICGEEQEVYVPTGQLTDSEIEENAGRLQREGAAKIAHARALRTFAAKRRNAS